MTADPHQQGTDKQTLWLGPSWLGTSGVLKGSRVRTLDGVLPVEYLECGDRIVTRSGVQRLARIAVQVLDRAELVRVRAFTLGHDRPDQDLLLAPGQRVLIRDWRAKALFGVTSAAIPVARLTDGEFIASERHRDVRIFTLEFETDEVIYVEGLELACPAFAQEELNS